MTRDTTPTDRRAYEKPEIGDDWAQAWDELVEDLDSASLYVDSTENTSASDPIPGTTHFEDVDAGSVSAEHAANDNTSTTLTQPHQPKLNAYKSTFSWADIPWEDKGEPIIDGSNASGGEAAWPTVIHAGSSFGSPIDDWYCYWSTHDLNYIGLSTAPDPWGPWSYHSEVFSDAEGGQTASPSAIVVPEDSRLNLYYHTDPNFGSGDGKQHTKLATSPLSGDGTSFTIQGPALDAPKDGRWDGQERSYLKALRVGRSFFAVYQGRDYGNNAKGIGVAHSFDGEQFSKTQIAPAYDNTQFENANPRNLHMDAPSLSHLGGELSIIYGDNDNNVARALPYRDHDKALVGNGEIVYEPASWQSGYPNVQDFVADDEYVYMIYYDEVSGTGRTIGVARAEQGSI